MIKKTLNILMLAALLTSFSCGNSKKEEDTKEVAEEQNEEKFEDTNIEKDTEFAVDVADEGMLEVQLGQLALTNATSAQVKAFAQTMVTDHGTANDELKSAAAQKAITLPAALSEKAQKTYDDFAQKKREDFDKDYVNLMIDNHKETINKFEKESENGKDADLKTWATGKLAALKHHLEMAEQLKDGLKDNH